MSPDNRNRALPASFLSPETASLSTRVDGPRVESLAVCPGDASRRDLAIAVDGTFVETTSEAAARSMAKFYSVQEGAGGIKVEYAIQRRVDQDGRTLYRIRPLSHPSAPSVPEQTSASPPFDSGSTSSEGHLPFARPSNQPPRSVAATDPSNGFNQTSPNQPGLGSTLGAKDADLLDPSSNGLKDNVRSDSARLHAFLPLSSSFATRRDLRKAGSTPALLSSNGGGADSRVNGATRPSQLSSFASAADLSTLRKPRHPSEGDVLGRILGWREDVLENGTSGNDATERTIRKGSGSARAALPELFRKGSGAPMIQRNKDASRSEELDTSDLPEDCELSRALLSRSSGRVLKKPHVAVVEELVDRTIQVDSDRLRGPSPFGSEVRLPRQVGSDPPESTLGVRPAPWSVMQGRTMREVASNDSIRTAKADDPLPSPATSRRPRFKDPSVFDVFHALPPPSSPPLAGPPPLGQHARVPSSSSLASSASGHSQATGQQITVHFAPGDDPRFVIWGYKESLSSVAVAVPTSRRPSLAHPISSSQGTNLKRGNFADPDLHSSPSTSGSGSPATTNSRRWSLSARGGGPAGATGSGWASPATSVRDSVGSNPASEGGGGGGGGRGVTRHAAQQRILMAATVERLVAELTSQISVELLSDFFLTYRHYLAPVDLLDLLLTRFDWAMSPATSSADDALRRVVRVRTFVVLRYWLLNHFMDDFYPSKDIRTRLTEWLNASARDPRFRENQKDARLIKNLKKTVRKCKETFVLGRPTVKALAEREDGEGGGKGGTGRGQDGGAMQTLGYRWSEEDVDLDLVDSTLRATAKSSPPNSAAYKFGTLRVRKGSAGPPGSTLSASTSSEPAFPLPGTSQNPIARSFATALGTFGRLKRIIGQRTASNAGLGVGEEPGDDVEFEQNEMGDLLWVKGGLEKYLDYWDIKRDDPSDASEGSPELPVVVVDEIPLDAQANAAVTPKLTQARDASESVETTTATDPSLNSQVDQVGLGILTRPQSSSRSSTMPVSTEYSFPALKPIASPPSAPDSVSTLPIFDPETYSSSSAPLAAGWPRDRPASARIELDDLDDSDSDDEDVVEVKRTLKRLPNAHNLRMPASAVPPTPGSLRSSLESEASYGFGTGPARLSYDGRERESVLFVDDEEGGDVGVTVIPNFILEGLLDSEDEDEPGDVEAALRRLEGLVDTSREREKAKKVERQMQRSEKLDQERKKQDGETSESPPASLPSSNGPSLVSRVEEKEEVPSAASEQRHSIDLEVDAQAKREAIVAETGASPAVPDESQASIVPFSSQISPPITTTAAPTNSLEPTMAHATSRLGVPPAYPTVAGRKATLSRIFGVGGGGTHLRPVSSSPPVIASAPAPPTHRSFLLFCRTEILAQQFTLIERDMLRMLSYQELVSGSWRDRIVATDVLDWEAYLKDRRKADLAARQNGQQAMSAVQDVIARFNLMANWVGSEILLTANLDERAILIGKFIRLAFKCYCQSNFQTVMQIVHGLQIPHVERLRKTWAKVPSWEIRKLEGMQRFISHLKNFTHLRDLMNRLAAEYSPSTERGHLGDPISTLAMKGCIPFTGLFLRDLALNAELPTFLDPTCTDSPASVDNAGSLTSVADPNAFESLGPLAHHVDLFPLVNLHKFRKLATIVQRIRTFQALSERYTFEPVQNVYFKCLKIRSLDQLVMQELSSRLEP